ncbi:DUF3139 domain-containing protein [Staphylococcus simulans]|uniref:DUF3139 domain-containing protein n=1 Tax=Staphylococcus simulans TaxID=1286 RepID=UPI003364E8A3
MSKKVFHLILIIIGSLIIATVFFFGLKTYQGKQNLKLVDQYIAEHQLQDDIKSEKKKFNAKDGVYYKEVVFKDEPQLTYVIQPMGTSKGLFAQAFDTQTRKHIKKAKHNFFDDNYNLK